MAQPKRPSPIRFPLQDVQHLVLLIQTIRAGSYPTRDTLGALIGRDARTITRWVRALRQLGAPIAYDAQKRGLYFTHDWHLDP